MQGQTHDSYLETETQALKDAGLWRTLQPLAGAPGPTVRIEIVLGPLAPAMSSVLTVMSTTAASMHERPSASSQRTVTSCGADPPQPPALPPSPASPVTKTAAHLNIPVVPRARGLAEPASIGAC